MSGKELMRMGKLDNATSAMETSCSSKDSEIENVDAIKKYIEEQEMLLRCSSNNDNVNQIKSDGYKEVVQNEVDLELQLTFSNNSETSTTNKIKKVGMDSVYNEETTMSASPNPSSTDSLLDLENEENLANEAAANLLSLGQNCLKMQININQKKHNNEIIQTNIHNPAIICNDNVDSGIQHLDTCKEIENLQVDKTNDKDIIDLSTTNITPKITDEELHLSIKDAKLQKLEKKCGKNIMQTFATASELKTKNTLSKDVCSEQSNLLHRLLTSTNNSNSEINNYVELDKATNQVQENKDHCEESLSIATSVMDMILNNAEAAIHKKKAAALSKHFSPEKANSSVPLAIGSKVEAKDFCELWHPAQIVEVDCEEMEVLVQFDNQPKMHNEWISISSPRLRPMSSVITKPASPPRTPMLEMIMEPKVDDKQKVSFAVGERCLARWRDNRRFIATVQNDLGNGHYEVMFDDGFQWKCTLSRMYKLKDANGQHDYPRFGSAGTPPPAAAPAVTSPAVAAAATAAGPPPLPLYHTHLFDPTRDYLGSKSERREQKRKLNIKEIFNIGQKRKKLHIVDKDTKCNVASIKQEIEIKSEPSTLTNKTAAATESFLSETIPELQEKNNITKKPPAKKKTLAKKKKKLKDNDVKPVSNEIKKEKIPEAVASIIGTVCNEEPEIEVKMELPAVEIKDSNANDIKPDDQTDDMSNALDISNTVEKQDLDVVMKEETKLFEIQDGVKHEEVIGKIKEVITKLEDGINEVEKTDIKQEETKEEVIMETEGVQPLVIAIETGKEKPKKSKSSSKVKKGKKLRLMQEKKVKKQVEKVKCQLEEMKKQVEAMRQEIMLKTEELASSRRGECAAPEAALLPGEWCCRWVDGQPEGAVSEVPNSGDSLVPRRSVQVEDKRLPPGWTKHMVRRSLGSSAGKWDVVLVSPENRRIHTKNDMRVYLENNPQPALKPFETALMDFGIHLKLSRRLGWVRTSAEGAPPPPPPGRALPASSPLLKRSKLSLKNNHHNLMPHKKRPKLKIKPLRPPPVSVASYMNPNTKETNMCTEPVTEEAVLDGANIKDGFVDVGSLRVQVISTLLRCPAEGCFKNFRNTTLLKMHIKHYHRELRKSMGNTPKVLDLAYARTRPSEAEMKRLKREAQQRIIKVKLPRMHTRAEVPPSAPPEPAPVPAPEPLRPPVPAAAVEDPPRPVDSPKLRNALAVKPTKRPRVLLPVRPKETEPTAESENVATDPPFVKLEKTEIEENLVVPKQEIPDCGVLDFETAISTHTVTKMVNGSRIESEKRRKTFACIGKLASEDEEWAGGSEDTRSSYPSCGTPDSAARTDTDDPCAPAAPAGLDDSAHYMYTDNGERIKLVRMKREEIINCHCGFREEDGLMVQCELCLCWQHALCHNIQREAEVPEKYTCSICLNPRRGRRRQRFMHDQDRLYEGLLPGPGGGRACDALRRSHELSGNLLRIEDALHAVRVNMRVAQTKNHPKLYLWARNWESVELSFAQEKLNSEYSDLNVIINNLGKENLSIKAEDLKEMALGTKTPSSDEQEEKQSPVDKENHIGSPALLSGLLSSPGAASLDLPITESELEKLAKSVHEHESRARVRAPQPEAAIENSVCRARLLRHIQRCHALLDQRLDSIEAQVAELESQDASLEDDESPEYCPRAKRALVMIARDLDAMEELGIVT